MKNVGKPCAGEPHARFDGRGLETGRDLRNRASPRPSHLRGCGIMLCVVLDLVADELDRVHERIAGRFARAEPLARVRRYVSGLVAGLERKNGWTLAEQAGERARTGCSGCCAARTGTSTGCAMTCAATWSSTSATRTACWSVDETGFLKKGTRSAGVQRQYSGTAGRTENCQVGVFLAYASARGHALIDRRAVPAEVLGRGPGPLPGGRHP